MKGVGYLANEKIISFIPSSLKLQEYLTKLRIPLALVQKTLDKVPYDRYLIKIDPPEGLRFKCVSKQKYLNTLKRKGLPSTSIFIDYESWFYTLKISYQEKPELDLFFDDIKRFGTIKDIYFFGDFTGELKSELHKIRKFTNKIIECYAHESKEYSDVIMLDYIYRYVNDFPSIEQYIIFTNDGHFSPVITTLQSNFNKKVITVGIENQTNLLLYSISMHHLSITPSIIKDIEKYWYGMLRSMLVSENNGKFLTFSSTLDYNIKRGLSENIAYNALQRLIAQGYIDFEEVVRSRCTISVMYPNWARLKEDGIFDFENPLVKLQNS